MKKSKAFLVSITLFMIMTVTISVYAIANSYHVKAFIQKEAMEAYAALLETFTNHIDGSVTYSDDYAGAWIKGSTLYVAIVSESPDAVSPYEEILSGFNCVKYVEAEYSLKELRVIHNKVFEILNEEYPNSIVALYVDVRTNRMVFEAEKNIDEIKSSLESLLNSQTSDHHINANKFVIIKGERVQLQ